VRDSLERATSDALKRDARQPWLERVDREGEDLATLVIRRNWLTTLFWDLILTRFRGGVEYGG
jgi:hypothetical protein